MPDDVRPPLPIDAARLCPDCDVLTELSTCPVCDRAQTFPLALWLVPLDAAATRPWASERVRTRRKRARPPRLRWTAGHAGDPQLRWLIVVRAGEWELYHYLQRRFGTMDDVAVIVDRRKGERRQARADAARGDRRGTQRRRPLSRQDREWWETAGFRIVARAAAFRLYEAPAPAAR